MLQPAEAVTKAQPMIMEVSLVTAPSQQAAAAPIAQPKPVEPKKQPVKKAGQEKEAGYPQTDGAAKTAGYGR